MAQHVTIDRLDRVECRSAAGNEPRDGEARLAREHGRQRRAGPQKRTGAPGQVADELTRRRVRRGQGQVVLAAPESGQIRRRQVDAAGTQVLADVLQVLDDLQPAADVVRQRQCRRGGDAEHAQHQPTDRVGGVTAVVEQVVERGVAVLPLISAVRLDQVLERTEAEPPAGDRRAEPRDEWVLRATIDAGLEVAFEPVERGEPITLVLVADVVGQPSEPVDRQQVGPHVARQEPERDREVLTGALRQDARPREIVGHPVTWRCTG